MPYEEDGTYTEDSEVDDVEKTENDQEAPPSEDEPTEGTEQEVDGDADGDQDHESTNEEPKPDEDVLSYVKRLENRVHMMHRKLEKLKKAPDPKVPEKIDDANAPKIEDFDTIEDYEKASAAFSIDQRVNDGIRKALERKPGEDIEQAREVFKTQIQEDGPKAYNDFEQVVGDPKLPITHEIIDAVRETDNENVSPADLLYYLGKNPDETARLSRMSTIQVAKAIAKIEINLEAVKQKNPKEQKRPKKTVSTAPEPISPIDSTVIITKDPNKMTQREYEAWRAAGNG